jgi:integrase
MIKLYRRGRVWWVDISRNGRERRSLKTYNRQVAEQLQKQIELDVLSGGKLHQLTWKEFAAEFELALAGQVRDNTKRGYLFTLDKLTDFFEGRRVLFLDEVTPAIVCDFLADRQRQLHPSRKRTMTDGGMRSYLRVLHLIFSFAVERDYIRKNPVVAKNRNAQPGRTRPFSQEEVTAMLTSPYLADKAYLRAVVLLFLHTGLRIGDVIELKKADVDGAYLNLVARKNNASLRLPIHTELREALNAHEQQQSAKQQQSPYLFTTDTGCAIVGLDKHLRRLWKACGVAGGHAHRFRDTFAVQLLEKGASLYDVAKLLGIDGRVVEMHYSPYVKELQERGRRLVSMLNYTTAEIPTPVDPETPSETKAWKN